MPLRFSILAVFILQLFVIASFNSRYETNDDVFLTMVASGKGVCLAPDEHLVFTNVLIGKGLKWLYTQSPSIPWYGLYLLVVHFAAQTTILYCALTVGRDSSSQQTHRRERGEPLAHQTNLRFGLYLIYFVLVEMHFLNRSQFTTTAFVASQAGILIALTAWQRRVKQSDAPVLGPLCVAITLLLLGAMVRIESLAMALLVALPLALLFIKDFSMRAVVPCGVAATVASVLIVGAVAYDHWTYASDPAWREFRNLNQLRGNFHDRNWVTYTPETSDIFKQVGWSENDQKMIASWYSDDTELYNEAKLKSIVAAYPWQSARPMGSLYAEAFGSIAQHRIVLTILLAMPFILLSAPGGWKLRWAILGSAVGALLLVALVVWLRKVPPERVYLPLVSFPLCAALLSFAWLERSTPQSTCRTWAEQIGSWWIWSAWRRLPTRYEIAGTLLAVSLIMGCYRQYRLSVRVEQDRVALNRFLEEAQSAGKTLCVMWEAALPIELTSRFDNLASWSRLPMLSIAWPQRTPWQTDIKRKFGVPNIAKAIYERDDFILVATETHQLRFRTFAQEHFGSDVEFVPSYETGQKFAAGSFQRQLPNSEVATKRLETEHR